MGQGRQHGDVRAGPQRQVMGRLDMRRAHQIDTPRIDDDQLAPRLAAAASCALANTGWASVGLAPMITITSHAATLSKSCVPAEVPKVVFSP